MSVITAKNKRIHVNGSARDARKYVHAQTTHINTRAQKHKHNKRVISGGKLELFASKLATDTVNLTLLSPCTIHRAPEFVTKVMRQMSVT